MSNVNSTTLLELSEKHVQFCIGLKSLVDGGCPIESLDSVLEQLCEQAELSHQNINLLLRSR